MKNCNQILLVTSHKDAEQIELVLNKNNLANSVVHKTNSQEAIEYLKQEQNTLPCCILLDINLPQMDAFKFVKTLKADPALKQLPIIALISSETNGDVVQSVGLDITGFIQKPFAFKQFTELIKKLGLPGF